MKPSIRAILWNDWPALGSSIGIVLVWEAYFCYPLLRPSLADDPDFALLAIISTLALQGVLVWRLLRVLLLFARGVEVPARITSISLAKDRGRVEYSFQLGGSVASSWSPVHKTARVLALEPGQSVEVLVNPRNPRQAILKALYV
ncbi:DUF3592 domain-containing protein [Massilia niastensis]|uniref:DUF3592 domain-containing protein n=1 Tax=Massilia niastensis TaxID=544911 RepID=UPI000A07182F|nr:DUF3592 domain-containing protein [Massilia niastensis]